MLVLTRRSGEQLVIGDQGEIVVRILGVRGRQVRIGIEAPQSVVINREEIHQRVIVEREQANSIQYPTESSDITMSDPSS